MNIFQAVKAGNLDLIRSSSKKDCNSRDPQGYSPLHWASRMNRPETVELLLQKGAAVQAADRKGKTPLHWALAYGYTACATVLMQGGASTTPKDGGNTTPEAAARRLGRGNKAQDALVIEKEERKKRRVSVVSVLVILYLKDTKLPWIPRELIDLLFPWMMQIEIKQLQCEYRSHKPIPRMLTAYANARELEGGGKAPKVAEEQKDIQDEPRNLQRKKGHSPSAP